MKSQIYILSCTLITALLLAYCYFHYSSAIEVNVVDEVYASRFRSGDTGHYIRLAGRVRENNSPFEYLAKNLAHRQLLYPAALAFAQSIGPDTNLNLARVNIAFTCFSVLLIIWIGAKIFSNPFAGFFGASVFFLNGFYFNNATTRLLTEPLFIFLTLGVIYNFLRYLEGRKTSNLCFAVALGGLTYLTRPNGLFLSLSLVGSIFVYDILVRKERSWQKLSKQALTCFFVFVLVSSASWLPRLVYAGNPLDHGYLPNYLWVDDYETGHTSKARYHFDDYASSHDFEDVVDRIAHGINKVAYVVPMKKFGQLSSLIFLAGIAVAVLARKMQLIALLLFLSVQLLPIIWTSLSNPSMRIPAAVLLPFGVVFACYLFHAFCLAFAALGAWFAKLSGFTPSYDVPATSLKVNQPEFSPKPQRKISANE